MVILIMEDTLPREVSKENDKERSIGNILSQHCCSTACYCCYSCDLYVTSPGRTFHLSKITEARPRVGGK